MPKSNQSLRVARLGLEPRDDGLQASPWNFSLSCLSVLGGHGLLLWQLVTEWRVTQSRGCRALPRAHSLQGILHLPLTSGTGTTMMSARGWGQVLVSPGRTETGCLSQGAGVGGNRVGLVTSLPEKLL